MRWFRDVCRFRRLFRLLFREVWQGSNKSHPFEFEGLRGGLEQKCAKAAKQAGVSLCDLRELLFQRGRFSQSSKPFRRPARDGNIGGLLGRLWLVRQRVFGYVVTIPPP